MAEIRWTEEAYQWLRDIHDYIADDNPDAVQKVVSGIYEKAQLLPPYFTIIPIQLNQCPKIRSRWKAR